MLPDSNSNMDKLPLGTEVKVKGQGEGQALPIVCTAQGQVLHSVVRLLQITAQQKKACCLPLGLCKQQAFDVSSLLLAPHGIAEELDTTLDSCAVLPYTWGILAVSFLTSY